MAILKRRLILFFCLTFFSYSCSHYYYVPNIQNVPLFREKNEYRITAALGGGDESNCIEIQSAYSVSDKVGIMANFMSARGGTISSNHDWAKGTYFEGAIGYFKPISKYGVFEIYGGLGGSKQNHAYVSSGFSTPSTFTGTSELTFNKLFLQPSLGFTFNIFDIAVSTRATRLYFNNVTNQINSQLEPYEFESLNNIWKKRSYLFLEPSFTLRAGWKNVKIQFQAATSSYSNKSDMNFETFHLSLGAYFAIAQRFKKN